MRLTAIPLLAASLTSDPATVGLVSAAGLAPWALFGLLAGALSDRWDRRRLMWRVDLARGLVMAGLAVAVFLGHVSVPMLASAIFVLGAAQCLFDSSAVSLVPTVVPNRKLPFANSLLTTSLTLTGDLLGPLLAGVLFVVGAALPLGIDAATFLIAAALVASLPRSVGERERAADASPTSLIADVREGLRTVTGHPALRVLVGLSTVLGVVSGAVMAVLVLYVRLDLRESSSTYGILLAVFAVGALVGAMLAAVVMRRWSGTVVVTAVMLLTSAAVGGLALTTHTVQAGACLAAFGVAAGLWAVQATTLRQRVTPNRLLGRVTSVSFTVVHTAMTLGAVLGGVLAAQTSIRVTLAACAVALLGCPLVGFTRIVAGPETGADEDGTPHLGVAAAGVVSQ